MLFLDCNDPSYKGNILHFHRLKHSYQHSCHTLISTSVYTSTKLKQNVKLTKGFLNEDDTVTVTTMFDRGGSTSSNVVHRSRSRHLVPWLQHCLQVVEEVR